MVRAAGQRRLRSSLHRPRKAPDHLEVSRRGCQATSRTLHALPGVTGGWIWTRLQRKACSHRRFTDGAGGPRGGPGQLVRGWWKQEPPSPPPGRPHLALSWLAEQTRDCSVFSAEEVAQPHFGGQGGEEEGRGPWEPTGEASRRPWEPGQLSQGSGGVQGAFPWGGGGAQPQREGLPDWWVPEGTEGMLPWGPLCRPAVRLRTGAKILKQAEMQPGLEKGVCPGGGGTQSPWDQTPGWPPNDPWRLPSGASPPLGWEESGPASNQENLHRSVLPRDTRWQRSAGGWAPPKSEASSKGQQDPAAAGHESCSDLLELETPGCSPSPASR